VWALWATARGRPRLAVLLGALAVWLHPTYALSFLGLVAANLVSNLPATPRARFTLALGAAVAVAPPLLWSLSRFAPTSPESFRAAMDILATKRLPHHTDPARFADYRVALRVALSCLALWLARPRFRRILLCFIAPGVALTLLAVLAPHAASLRLGFPWRFSTVLVPVATALLVARALDAGERAHVSFRWLPAFAFVVLATEAVVDGARRLARPPQPELALFAANEFRAASARDAGASVLIPTEWSDVRLNAGVPVFVDYKSHPYKDDEVLAWWRRVALANAFYRGPEANRCAALASIRKLAPELHWVSTPGFEVHCSNLRPVSLTNGASLFAIERQPSAQ
jgi:hypothetical protein